MIAFLMGWPDDVLTSAHTARGEIHSPERAYARMPDEVRLAAAVVDACIWDDPRWAEAVLLHILGIAQPATSSRTMEFFKARKWRDVADVYEAARVTKAQRWAFELYLSGYTNREIGAFMSTSALAAKMQVYRATEKLRRVCLEPVADEEPEEAA